jgi:hypothetical protein
MAAPTPTASALFAALSITDEKFLAGTGGVLWGGTRAGLALLDYLRACGPPSPRVLSLGCGLGALELVCACQGGAVLATDLPAVRPLLARNLAANAAALAAGRGSLDFEDLDWAAAPALPPAVAARGPFDFALASDCVFWPELFEPLARTMGALARAQAPQPLPFFLLIEPRSPRELRFLAALEAQGFVHSRLDERHGECLRGAVSSACAIFVCTLAEQ